MIKWAKKSATPMAKHADQFDVGTLVKGYTSGQLAIIHEDDDGDKYAVYITGDRAGNKSDGDFMQLSHEIIELTY